MDVFSFRDRIVDDYEKFSRSFTKIRSDDIGASVENAYRSGRFWPAPLIQLNPGFVPGGSIDDLVGGGLLEPECGRIFRIKSKDDPFGKPLILHLHQREAIETALKILNGEPVEKKMVLGSRLFTRDNVATGGTAIP